VIELPPQPVSLDLAFWLNNYFWFEQIETEQTLKKSELEEENEKEYIQAFLDNEYIQALLDEEQIDGVTYVTLSAMGVLFNERCRLQFAKQETTTLSLIPKDETAPERKTIDLREDHGKDILQAFAEKIRRSPYVKKIINSLPFNPKRTNPIRRTYPNGKIEFVLTWTDRGLGLCIQTTGRNLAETNSIALHLAKEYKN
jgi:hypothetical protein